MVLLVGVFSQVFILIPFEYLIGVTRQTVIELVASMAAGDSGMLPVVERRISLSEFHSADEVFTTGSMGELTPVVKIDGRRIGYADDDSQCGGDVNLSTRRPVTAKLQAAYHALTEKGGVPLL